MKEIEMETPAEYIQLYTATLIRTHTPSQANTSDVRTDTHTDKHTVRLSPSRLTETHSSPLPIETWTYTHTLPLLRGLAKYHISLFRIGEYGNTRDSEQPTKSMK